MPARDFAQGKGFSKMADDQKDNKSDKNFFTLALFTFLGGVLGLGLGWYTLGLACH